MASKFKSYKKNNNEDEYFSENDNDRSENEKDGNENESSDKEKDENDEKDEKQKKIRKIIRKPQPKLDATRLCGERGLKCLLDMFKNVKLKGEGFEFSDLELIISKYEYWAHRLFPKMKFEDVVERLEKLGDKREVKNMLNNLRMGLIEDPNSNKIDPSIEDEIMTERVMGMMNRIDTSNHELDEENSVTQTNKKSQIQQDDEDEDELFNRLLSSSNFV